MNKEEWLEPYDWDIQKDGLYIPIETNISEYDFDRFIELTEKFLREREQ